MLFFTESQQESEKNMSILYTDVPPLRTDNDNENFRDKFTEYLNYSDTIEIATGYVSKLALESLDQMIQNRSINHIILIVGMYYIEGMPESIYNTLIKLNNEWQSKNIGGVYIVRTFRYHGKCYLFSKNETPFAGIIGSANLGAISLDAQTRSQYEMSVSINDSQQLSQLYHHIRDLLDKCSKLISSTPNIPIIRGENIKLRNIDHVQKVNPDDVIAYKDHLVGNTFEIPLKVPHDHKDTKLRRSNINVCYAKGRKREWWEIEIIVSKKISEQPGYPEYSKPFMVVTDDGWKFKAWTCGDHNKNLYSKYNLKIMGYWLKGRLVAAGIVNAIDHVENDTEGKGLITQKMLEQYGKTTIDLTKTDQTTKDEEGNVLNVWLLSFLSNHIKKDTNI